MNFTLKIWRQKDAKSKGQFETVKISGIEEDMSFLEMLDIVNEQQMTQYRRQELCLTKSRIPIPKRNISLT
jgi:succinate dehydrogenase/fumarate reductase-like Fe-S protein